MTEYIPLTDDSEVLELGDEYRCDGLWNAVFDVGKTIYQFRNGSHSFEFRRPISDRGEELMNDRHYEPITDDNEVLCPGVDECRFRRTGELWSFWTRITGLPSTKKQFTINRPSYFEYEFRRPNTDLSTSQRIEYFCDQLKKTLLAKNADYGDSATKAPHLAPNTPAREAIEVRLSDKISRWRKLRLAGKAEVKESLEDTVLDTAGYCILWLCCVDEMTIPGEQSTAN